MEDNLKNGRLKAESKKRGKGLATPFFRSKGGGGQALYFFTAGAADAADAGGGAADNF